jgi:hypothetical protein
MPITTRVGQVQQSPYDMRPVTSAFGGANQQPGAYPNNQQLALPGQGSPLAEDQQTQWLRAVDRRLKPQGKNAYDDRNISGRSSDGKKLPDYSTPSFAGGTK